MSRALRRYDYIKTDSTELATPSAVYKNNVVRLNPTSRKKGSLDYDDIEAARVSGNLKHFLGIIDSLLDFEANWDGYESAKPCAEAIKNAKIWAKPIFEFVINKGWDWHQPFISTDEWGDVVLEFWYQDRNLTLDISSNEVTFFETRDADKNPIIVSGILEKSQLESKLKWLIWGN